MNTKTKVIISAALLALLTAPASARSDVGDGHNFPSFNKERAYTPAGALSFGAAPSDTFINRPRVRR